MSTTAMVPGVSTARGGLDAIFAPKNIAVIGATETMGSVGRTVLWNLVSNPFGGTVFPVNLKRASVLGIKAYPNIAAVPEKVDLAVVVTPAAAVPDMVGACAEAGVAGVIVISAGFKEMGKSGVMLEQEILRRRGSMRIIGPNCLGVMNPLSGLNATFASGMAKPGNVAFISQSGALCTAILDWSRREAVGFSAFVSVGSMLDVGWGDLIDYLGDDPHTQSIIIYMESIGNARAFLSAAREVALSKPIIVIKAGRTAAAAKAAASHTGALTGSDEVLDAALRRCGVLRVDRIADLFYMAEVLAKQPRPRGPRLTIVTNAGGPGVLATDALMTHGGELAPLDPQTVASLNSLLPPHWSRANPIDILGDASPERYAKSLEIAAKDESGDGVLVILTPQDMTDPTRTAEVLRPYAKLDGKPLLASWMGGSEVEAGRNILKAAGIPTFDYPDTAARAFNYMWRYTYNLRGLYETPSLGGESDGIDRASLAAVIAAARTAGRTLLTEVESKQLLAAYGIATTPCIGATTAREAVAAALKIGYPVVVKLVSHTLTHKTEVGGVQLNLGDAGAVRAAFEAIEQAVNQKAGPQHFQGVSVQPMVTFDGYELIVGSSIDEQFGPVLLFGSGGQLVEVYRDQAVALPPLNSTLARRMMEQTRIYTALRGVRGRKPVDLAALEQLLVRFSQLVVEQRWIKEIDINPLLAGPEGLVALDARVLLHDPATAEEQLPKAVIRPYPIRYVTTSRLKDGTEVTVRPIRPEDEPLMVEFHQSISERSVRFRYFHLMKLDWRVAHERLTRVCFNDYDRELALVGDYRDSAGRHHILGIARLSKVPGTSGAEFGLIVADAWQGRGLGRVLLRRLLDVGRQEKIQRIRADILSENLEMRRLCESLGFRLEQKSDDSAMSAEIHLD